MGVFDKLKNVFFEEEYVEIEEPAPIKKPKREKTTIAKKIDLPEMPKINEEKTAREKEIEEEVVERVEKKETTRKKESEFKFPMSFEEEDFKADEYVPKKREDKKTKENIQNKVQFVEEKTKYGTAYKNTNYNSKKEEIKTDYSSAGLYEGGEHKKEQKVFRPTPIISPIYGILDKNYKKDEIVQKKEVRLSSVSSRKADLDSVREKAYGDLASDITASLMDDVPKKEEKPVKEETTLEESLYDLTDSQQPVVNSVTVGDAEEYFNDLGLEYNIDYKDHTKEVASGRRTSKKKEEPKPVEDDEDSLFDLIDSMYDSEEE